MTDLNADPGTAPTISPEAAAAAAAAPGGAADQGGAGAAERPFYEGFADEKLRAHPSIVKFKTVEEMAHGLTAAEARLGVPAEQLLRVPTKPPAEDPEGWKAVWSKLGLPATPADYKLDLGADATDQDRQVAGDFAARMHKEGAPTQFVAAAVEWWNGQTKQAAEARQAEFDTARGEAETALKKDWGEAYPTRIAEIGRLLNKHGGEALTAELQTTLMGSNPVLIRALGDVVDRMAEPGAPGGKPGDGAVDRPMTPGQAKAARLQLESDPVKGAALMDKTHAMHKSVLAERQRLIEFEASRQ